MGTVIPLNPEKMAAMSSLKIKEARKKLANETAVSDNLKNAILADVEENDLITDKDVHIDAFNSTDDELANVSKEEMLSELGKTGVDVEQVTGKVVVDGITGETSMANPYVEDVTTEKNIESLQSLDVESTVSRMSELTKQQVRLLVPLGYTDAEVDSLIAMLETKLPELSTADINNMTSEQVQAFIGMEIYLYTKSIHKYPSATIKHFLVTTKASMAEKVRILDAMNEMNTAMAYFKTKPLEEIHSSIIKELDADPEKYPTEYHKYHEYLTRYIDKLSDGASNKFIQEEIQSASDKIKAIDDALTFGTIKRRLTNLKSDIILSFKDSKKIDNTILNFIGFLNADTTMNITFPVPKDFNDKKGPEGTLKLTTVWLLFLELIDIYRQIPSIRDLNHSEYYGISALLTNPKADNKLTDQDRELLDIANKYGLTLENINNARKVAILLSYILARVFKPKNLNAYMKYILSYTMNIISNSMQSAYLKITHELIEYIIHAFD